MTHLSDSVYRKLQVVTDQVKQQLQRKGVAIPVKNDDGSIALGHYTIVKQDNFYAILDFSNEVIVDKINLPQSAAIIANGLALGKFVDTDTLNLDRQYGFCEFEELLYSKLAEKNLDKNIDRADMMYTKKNINRDKKIKFKRSIMKRFEKLRNFA
jgi:hypothetical protein